jgi:hypothetical protein
MRDFRSKKALKSHKVNRQPTTNCELGISDFHGILIP